MARLRPRWSLVFAAALVGALLAPGQVLAADGATSCDPSPAFNEFAGEVAFSGGWERGTRATIEGQPLALCQDDGSGAMSGSFHWTAVQMAAGSPNNIVQVGYGRCLRVNNLPQWGSTNCNGSYYWYWAWGSDCGEGVTGSGGVYGSIPLRIGTALSSPPATKNIYVIREIVGGVAYYDAYVDGVLLQGTDARGYQRTARVSASLICWDSDSPLRSLAWFGEVFNSGDSMGGWSANGTANHLDYTAMRYSINTGWLVPSIPVGHCNVESLPAVYTCTVPSGQAQTDHIYVDTVSR